MSDTQKATPRPWAQGYTLLTERTKRWTEAQRRENDYHENARIFANFSSFDEGRGRILVAKFERPEDAVTTVRAVNSHDKLLKALKAIMGKLRAISDDDEGCLYINGRSAGELREPIALAEAAIKSAEEEPHARNQSE